MEIGVAGVDGQAAVGDGTTVGDHVQTLSHVTGEDPVLVPLGREDVVDCVMGALQPGVAAHPPTGVG